MSERPPPYPADTRSKGWRFEVDMEKVKASDTWLRAKTGAIRGALLLLWSEAWQQTPCGSLPNDAELLALLIDMPMATFTKHQAVLRRGWWLASDGRLYHDTISARVLAMLEKRAGDADRSAARRLRKAEAAANRAGVTDGVTDASRVTPGGVHRESDTKHQAPEPKRQKPPTPLQGKSAEPTASPSIPCPYDAIRSLYHARLPMLPKAKLMPVARQRALRKLWGWVLSSTKGDGTRRAETAEQALAWIGEYFGRAAENDFLTGRTPRSGEHANWQCDIDFLLTDRGMKHVIEKTGERAA